MSLFILFSVAYLNLLEAQTTTTDATTTATPTTAGPTTTATTTVPRGGGSCIPIVDPSACSGNGSCETFTATCDCNFGWTGDVCQKRHKEFWIMLAVVLGVVGLVIMGCVILCVVKASSQNTQRQAYLEYRMQKAAAPQMYGNSYGKGYGKGYAQPPSMKGAYGGKGKGYYQEGPGYGQSWGKGYQQAQNWQ